MKKCEVAVIGGGPAGYTAALHLAGLGKKVCLIEQRKDHLGGTCLNEGCIPVKALLESSELLAKMRQASAFGLDTGAVTANWKNLAEVARRHSGQLRKGVEFLLDKAKIDVVEGKAVFTDAHRVEVTLSSGESEEIEADYFIIATGSVSRSLPGISPDGNRVADSSGVLAWDSLPAGLLVLGGGVIGCEFASLFAHLGTEVTIVEIQPSLLSGEDEEIVRTLEREFKKRKIGLKLSTKISSMETDAGGVRVTLESLSAPGKIEELTAERMLVAVGRAPNTAGLGCEKIGLTLDKGFIPVDSELRTVLPHILAVGDVIATPMLAHTAHREGLVAAGTIAGVREDVLTGNIPRIVYSDPEVGCVGWTEAECARQGVECLIGRGFFRANGRAVIHQSVAGMVKLIADKKSGILVGAGIIGVQASELIHQLSVAVETRTTIDDLRRVMFGHPTVSEVIGDAIREMK